MEAPNVARLALDGSRADRSVRGGDRRTTSKGGPIAASPQGDACDDDRGPVRSTVAAARSDAAGWRLGRSVVE